MKIIWVTEDFPPMPGGIATFLSELAKGLTKKGHGVRVLAPEMSHASKFDDKQQYTVIRYRLSRYLSSLSLGWHVLKQIINEKPDILFVGHAMATHGLFVLLLCWCFRIPYVVLIHAGHIPIGRASMINRISAHVFLKNAALLFANSTFTYQLLLERGFSERNIKILTPGVDTCFFSPPKDAVAIEQIRSQYSALKETLILNVGRLVPKKNQRGIVKAVADLLKRGIPVRCVIAGSGPERDRLHQCIEELGISSWVSMIGNAEREKIRNLYQAADIVVLPSIVENDNHESFGIAALEASACGKPVIVGARGGQKDAVVSGETGVVVDAHDDKEIARAIALLIDKKDLANRMGEAGRHYVVTNFTWECVVDKAAEILSEAVY